MENTDYMQNPEFRDWLRNIGFDDKVLQDEINNDDTSRLDDLIRRFEEKNRREEEMKLWLLKQKQTQQWNSPVATADAVYAWNLVRNKNKEEDYETNNLYNIWNVAYRIGCGVRWHILRLYASYRLG